MTRVGLGAVVALVLLVAGGCAPVTSLPVSSETAERPATTGEPSNFASPTDMLQRYPTMRRQQL
jgi:hypothetical protein